MWFFEGPSLPATSLAPKDPAEAARWQATQVAYDLLYGTWEGHLEARILALAGRTKRSAWKHVDLSANLFKQAWNAVAKLYDQEPVVDHDSESGRALASLVTGAGFWSLAQRNQRDTLGLAENLIHLRVSAEGVPVYRLVPPHRVVAVPHPDIPGQPIRIAEAVEYDIGGRATWLWDTYDAATGRFSVVDHMGVDVTATVGRQFELARDEFGRFVLPYVVYHAAETGHLWDVRDRRELVEGTLNTATYYTLFGHVLRSATWAQRWMGNARLSGSRIAGEAGAERAEVHVDPAVVVSLEALDPDAPIQTGQWNPPVDPMVMIQAIQSYEARTLEAATGGNPEGARKSGDPRSGYAISISRDTQRVVQRRHEPVFQRSDLRLLSTTAAYLGTGYPQSGYRIAYRGIPLSGDEREADRTHVLELLREGLISKARAYRMLHPGATEREAAAEIAAAAAEKPEPQPELDSFPEAE